MLLLCESEPAMSHRAVSENVTGAIVGGVIIAGAILSLIIVPNGQHMSSEQLSQKMEQLSLEQYYCRRSILSYRRNYRRAIIAGAIVVGVNFAGASVAGVNFVGGFVAEQLSRSNCRLHRSNCRRSNYRRSINVGHSHHWVQNFFCKLFAALKETNRNLQFLLPIKAIAKRPYDERTQEGNLEKE